MLTVTLPLSKSYYNRLLTMALLCKAPLESFAERYATLLSSEAGAKDLQVMYRAIKALGAGEASIDVGESGTAARLLMAACTLHIPYKVTLQGHGRLPLRPMQPLIDSLQLLGGDVCGLGGKQGGGRWPLVTRPRNLTLPIPSEIEACSTVSSQFSSALMLSAPYLPNGLRLKGALQGVSSTYLLLTAYSMERCGCKVHREGDDILIPPGQYDPLRVEQELLRGVGDWSSAVYPYQWVALSPLGTALCIKGLWRHSYQPDEEVVRWMQRVGVATDFEEEGGVVITKVAQPDSKMEECDLSNNPDLIPSCIVTLLALEVPFCIRGVEHLRYKESDRLESLLQTARLGGYDLAYDKDWKALVSVGSGVSSSCFSTPFCIDPKGDHRNLMAWAPLLLTGRMLQLQTPEVVAKSFPSYWTSLSKFFLSCLGYCSDSLFNIYSPS